MNVVGATSSGEREEDPDHSWSPGTLKYYGRAELKTSDHRYQHSKQRRFPFYATSLLSCKLKLVLWRFFLIKLNTPKCPFLSLKACGGSNWRGHSRGRPGCSASGLQRRHCPARASRRHHHGFTLLLRPRWLLRRCSHRRVAGQVYSVWRGHPHQVSRASSTKMVICGLNTLRLLWQCPCLCRFVEEKMWVTFLEGYSALAALSLSASTVRHPEWHHYLPKSSLCIPIF